MARCLDLLGATLLCACGAVRADPDQGGPPVGGDALAPAGDGDGAGPDGGSHPADASTSAVDGHAGGDSGGGDGGVGDSAPPDAGSIVSGDQWNDQRKTNVQGHGGNIIKVGSTYYWFGEDKLGEDATDAYFQNVACSSSTDLVHWTFVGNALSKQATGDLGPKRIIERPKVIHNTQTGMYVMYMHVDTPGYGTGMVGVATSSSVAGSYTYLGSVKPLGLQSWDMNLFVDDDGTAYLLSHASDGALHIDKLAADYLSVTSSVAALKPNYEAPAMLKAGGRYYLFASELTGWDTNDNRYTTATSVSGPWSTWSTFTPVGSHTYNSQTMLVLPVPASQGTTFVFMGDRWNPSDLGGSTYVWLPLSVTGATVSLTWYGSWAIDPSTGAWSANPAGVVPGGLYKLICYRSGYALDSGVTAANGAAVVQSADDGGGSQKWRLVDVAGGNLALVSQASGLALESSGSAGSSGSVVQSKYVGSPSQQWTLKDAGGGYYQLMNVASHLALDNANTTARGASVIQYADNGGPTQKWELIAAP
jgi:hypothetical protein